MKSKNYISHQSLKQGLIYNKFSSVSKQILFEHSYEDYFTESAHRGKKMKSDKGSRLVQFKIQLLLPRIDEDRSQERRSGIQVISRILVSRVHIRDEKREKFNSYLLSVQSVLIDDTDSPLLTFVSRVSRWPRLRRLKSNHIFFVRNSIEDNSANYLCISDNQLNGKYLLYIRVVKNIYIFLIQRSNDSRWFFFFYDTHDRKKKIKMQIRTSKQFEINYFESISFIEFLTLSVYSFHRFAKSLWSEWIIIHLSRIIHEIYSFIG